MTQYQIHDLETGPKHAVDTVAKMFPPLTGFTVAVTAHRRWEEQTEMLTRRGATVIHGPVLYTSLLQDADTTIDATRRAISAEVDYVVLTTGIGTRSWFAAADSAGLDAELRSKCLEATVIARSPKARSAAIGCGLEVQWQASTETSHEVIETLRSIGVAGKRIVVQRDGGEAYVADRIRELGAVVIDVPVYRCGPPTDPSAALRLIESVIDDRVDAVTFTSSFAVTSIFDLATDGDQLRDAFTKRAHAVAVGPVTASTLREFGIDRIVEPERARLGSMIQALMCELGSLAIRLEYQESSAVMQGDALITQDGLVTTLTSGERRLLTTLLMDAPAVVSKAVLATSGQDSHAVEAAIGRLRSKLGPLGPGIRAVPRRGYSSGLVVGAVE